MGVRNVSIPSVLRLLRFTQGLTQSGLAKRIGASQSYLSRVERGIRDPRPFLRQRIAETLGVEARVLFAEPHVGKVSVDDGGSI